MRLRPWTLLLGAALVLPILPSPSHAETKSRVRFSLEAGPSFDKTTDVLGDRDGYALAGGIELGRKLGLALSSGVEHYGGSISPYLLQTGQSPPTVRVEGDVTKVAITGSLGVRFAAPLGALDGFVEAALGSYTILQREARWVDPSSGAAVAGGGGLRGFSSSVLAELGAGLRTRRGAGFDWTVGVRFRNHAQMSEGESGRSVQLRLGIVTR